LIARTFIVEQTLNTILRILDPADNSTGGGSASAVAGAMAAALAAMVGRLTIGKPGMESEDYYRPIIAEAEELSLRLLQGARLDSESFDAVMAAYRMPKISEPERTARQRAVSEAILQATNIPLANAEDCRRVFELCNQLWDRSNPKARSDLECAFHLARAGLSGCLDNVAINLPNIKDESQIQRIQSRAEHLRRLEQGK
jgi:formiminotetrahydrofolate cyclodeaminase